MFIVRTMNSFAKLRTACLFEAVRPSPDRI
jgi:hypothetical protein